METFYCCEQWYTNTTYVTVRVANFTLRPWEIIILLMMFLIAEANIGLPEEN